MRCRKCRKKIPNTANFCPYCGQEQKEKYVSVAYKQAVEAAKANVKMEKFTRDELIEQLELYFLFSHDEAAYGADHCGVDWDKK